MSASKTKAAPETATTTANEVRLVGRLSQAPEERVLPSGDTVWTFRVVVTRPPGRSRSRQPVDALECAAWTARARRSVAAWSGDDVVEVVGSLHRRFYRSGAHAPRVVGRRGRSGGPR